MRENLKKYICRLLPAFGSMKIKEHRREIIANAQDRYDEEIAGGASPKDAYQTAIKSLGDINDLQKETGVTRRSAWILAIILGSWTIPGFILSIFISWHFFIPWAAVTLLTGIALKCLFFGDRRHLRIFSLCSIIAVLILIFWIRPMMKKTDYYVYTDIAEKIESISYVEVTKLEYLVKNSYDIYEDKLEYRVLETVDPDQKTKILRALGRLPYSHWSNDPPYLSEGDHGFLIVISDTKEEMMHLHKRYVLYCRDTFVEVYRDDVQTHISCYRQYCNSDDWNRLLAVYLRETYERTKSDY